MPPRHWLYEWVPINGEKKNDGGREWEVRGDNAEYNAWKYINESVDHNVQYIENILNS